MKRISLLLIVLINLQSPIFAQYAKWVVEPIYDQIEEFNGSLAAVQRDGKWGCINQEGVEIVACEYEKITPFVNGVAIAISGNDKLQAIIHEDGLIIDKFKTQAGEQILMTIDPRYPYFGNGMLLVTNGLMGTLKDGKHLKWGYLDTKGVLQIPVKYYYAMPFSENKAGVADEKMRFSYIDNTGNVVIADNMNGGRTTGAFGFYNGRALVSEKKKFTYIDETGRKVADYTVAEPNEQYKDIKSDKINCGGNSAVIDSFGRINRVIQSNGFVSAVVKQEPPKAPLKGDFDFVLNGEKINESVSWITTKLAVIPYEDKLGVIKVQETPVIEFELLNKSVHAIFGNIEPVKFTLINDTGAKIDNIEIKCNDEIIDESSISTSNLHLSFSISKPTDAEVEVVQERISITQRGVLLLDKSVDIIIVDEPAINIIGRNDLVYYKENNTASLSVDIQNRSKYLLKDAVLTMNNYQTKITVEPNSTINCPTFFGVVPEDDKIDISISVKHEKAQIVTKQGTMLVENLTGGSK